MERYAAILREVAGQIGLPPVKQLAMQPGMKAVYRVTLYYTDLSASNAVVTLLRSGSDQAVASAVYQGHFGHRPLARRLAPDEYDTFVRALQNLKFDALHDQENIPLYKVNLCLVERGAGSFLKGVVFSPQKLQPPYSALYAALQRHLPEALREVR